MRFHPYTSYKPSGIEWLGNVPDGWALEKTKWLFEIKKRIVGELGYEVLSITQNGIKIKDTESGDGQLSMDYSKYQLVEVGDFAMNHMDLLTGYVDISQYEGVTSPDYRVFVARDTNVTSKRFYLYLFQLGYKNKIFFPFGQGSSQLGRWRLPAEQFNDFVFPLPSIDEQQAIADFLDRETAKVDTLIAKQEKLIELLKEKRQAVISHAVTKGLNPKAKMKDSGIEWLGEVPEHWGTVPLKWAVRLVNEKSSAIDNNLEYVGMEQIESWSGRRIELENSVESEGQANEFQIGDVLFGKLRPYLAKAWKANIGGCCSSELLVLRPERFASAYLHRLVLSVEFIAAVDSSTYGSKMPRASWDFIGALVVPVPPHAEQDAIVDYLDRETSKIDTLIAKAEQAIALQKEHRTALISAAVTGTIDVREAA